MPGDDCKTGDVISMERFLAARRFRAGGIVESYWQALRGPRVMPARAEIDPRGIEDALDYAFIGERIAPGHVRLRVAGSHLSDLMGMEVRGMPLSSFLSAAARPALVDVLARVLDTPAMATVTLVSAAGFGRPRLDAQLRLLPLESDLGEPSRVLGSLEADGGIGRAPRRFDIADTVLEPLLGGTPLPREGDPAPAAPDAWTEAAPPDTDGHGLSEDAGAYTPPPRRHGAPHLRLVKTERED